MRTILLILLGLGTGSCDAILEYKTNFEPHPFQVVQLLPQVYRAGDKVPIKGEYFFDQMRVEIAGVEYPVSYPEDSEAELGYETNSSFILPTDIALRSAAGTKSGRLSVDLKRNNRTVALNHVYLAEEKDFPLMTGDAANICESQQFYNAKGELSRGTKACIKSVCNEDGQVDCLATKDAPAFLATNLAKKIDVGDAIASIKGERIVSVTAAVVTPSCTTNAVVGCVTTATYKSADWTNLTAANIKNGVVVAGLTGTYPSSSNLLTGASATADLDFATFDAKIKSASAFEWFGPNGVPYSYAGDADITAANLLSGVTVFGMTGTLNGATSCTTTVQATCQADSACTWNGSTCSVNTWNIRYGISLNGSTGALKTNCKNRMNTSIFNSDLTPPGNVATTVGTANDWWDTIDDYNNNLAFPTTLVSSFTAESDCSYTNWQDVTTDGTCDATTDDCMMKDRITGLVWSESYPVTGVAAATTGATWSAAVNRCDVLVYGGRSDWRLPTQKELTLAYVHGIRSVGYNGTGTIRGAGSTDNNDLFISNTDATYWSASSPSDNVGAAWFVSLTYGLVFNDAKVGTYRLVCVAP